jgi:hypothetical protein
VRFWRRPIALWVTGLVLLAGVAIGLALAPRVKPATSAFARNARIRAAALNAQIEQTRGDYILMVGDSHIERTFLPRLCGVPVLGFGFGGANAADLLQAVAALSPTAKARAILLTVGTNDMLDAPPPGDTGPITFERNATSLVERLRSISPRVVVTDVPPIQSTKPALPADTPLRYTEGLRRVCAGGACAVAPLFAEASQTPKGPLAFKPDGVHLVDYRSVYERAGPYLCGT